jgi:hypothetical protein
MVKCEKCGKDFIKEKQLGFIRNKLGTHTFELLCSKCRKAAAAEKLMDIYKDMPPN